MTTAAMSAEALSRAAGGQSLTNYPAIYAGFLARGLSEAEIKPRENVFTFNAWLALGRCVRKGEHGVRVTTWIQIPARVNAATGETERKAGMRCKATTVFHVSQTEVRA